MYKCYVVNSELPLWAVCFFIGDWLYQECLNFEFNNERYDEWSRPIQNYKECFWNKSPFVFRTEARRRFSTFLLCSELLLRSHSTVPTGN
jgi:hypothetical protein